MRVRVLDQGPASGDQGNINFQRLDEVQDTAVAPSGGQHDVNTRVVDPSQRGAHGRRQLIAAVDQRAIDVDCQETVHENEER